MKNNIYLNYVLMITESGKYNQNPVQKQRCNGNDLRNFEFRYTTVFLNDDAN